MALFGISAFYSFILFITAVLLMWPSCLVGIYFFRRFSVMRSIERVSASIRTANFAGGCISGFALLFRGALALPLAKPSALAHPLGLGLLPPTEPVAAFLSLGGYRGSSFGLLPFSGGLWPLLGGSGCPSLRLRRQPGRSGVRYVVPYFCPILGILLGVYFCLKMGIWWSK